MDARRSTGPVWAARPHLRPGLCCTPSRLVAFLLFLVSLAAAGVATAASNVVQYTYDAAGNITNIQRQTAPGFAITSFMPTSGPVGTAVTIYGTGFSATPANNGVQFNGTAATVSASDAGSISTTVPTGATTGRITVTVNGVTATSGSDFVVVVPGVPTITSFSPGSALAGATVTVSGTNFDTTTGGTTVKLNGVTGAATVTDSSTLTFTVPGGAASGKITATTALGTGTSATDFIVPPPGLAPADIVSTLRVSPGGGNANIAVGAPGKSGLVLFDAQPNVFYSIQLAAIAMSPTTATLAYQVIKPDNTVLLTGSVAAGHRPSIDLPMLAAAGTYGLLLSPGSATLNTNVRVEVNPVITIDGAAAPSTQDFAYQSSRFVFNASAGQHIGIGLANVVFTPVNVNSPYNAVRVFRPDGIELTTSSNPFCYGQQPGNPEGNCDVEMLAPITGTYTVIFETPSNAYATFAMQLSNEVTGTLTPDVTQAVTLARMAQDARFAFNVNAGDSLALNLSAAAPLPRAQNIYLLVYKPDGSPTPQSCSATPPAALYCELNTLAVAGTYNAYVDPSFGAYGSFNLTLKQGPMLLPTDPPAAFSPASASESARFRFSGAAGQNMSVGVAGVTNSTAMSVFSPNGTPIGLIGPCGPTTNGNCRAWLVNLPQTGTYSVQLRPPNGSTSSGNISLSTEITGTLLPGAPQTVASRPGQVARLSFSGNAGDSVAVKVFGVTTNVSTSGLTVYLYKPDGTAVSVPTLGGLQTETYLNYAALPATGTYALVVDPAVGQTWQGKIELDPGSSMSVDGPAVNPVTTVAGEPLRYTFSATAGQRIDFGLSGLTYAAANSAGTSIGIYSPTGATVASATCATSGTGSCDAIIASAPATGTYSMIIVPPQTSSITGGAVTLSTPLAGSFVIGDPGQTIAVTRPGQTARYSFSGAAGQLLRVNWSGVTIQGTSTVSISIVKPDGTTLTSSSFANGANSGLSVPALPTAGTYTVFLDPASAATFSATLSLVLQ